MLSLNTDPDKLTPNTVVWKSLTSDSFITYNKALNPTPDTVTPYGTLWHP